MRTLEYHRFVLLLPRVLAAPLWGPALLVAVCSSAAAMIEEKLLNIISILHLALLFLCNLPSLNIAALEGILYAAHLSLLMLDLDSIRAMVQLSLFHEFWTLELHAPKIRHWRY